MKTRIIRSSIWIISILCLGLTLGFVPRKSQDSDSSFTGPVSNAALYSEIKYLLSQEVDSHFHWINDPGSKQILVDYHAKKIAWFQSAFARAGFCIAIDLAEYPTDFIFNPVPLNLVSTYDGYVLSAENILQTIKQHILDDLTYFGSSQGLRNIRIRGFIPDGWENCKEPTDSPLYFLNTNYFNLDSSEDHSIILENIIRDTLDGKALLFTVVSHNVVGVYQFNPSKPLEIAKRRMQHRVLGGGVALECPVCKTALVASNITLEKNWDNVTAGIKESDYFFKYHFDLADRVNRYGDLMNLGTSLGVISFEENLELMGTALSRPQFIDHYDLSESMNEALSGLIEEYPRANFVSPTRQLQSELQGEQIFLPAAYRLGCNITQDPGGTSNIWTSPVVSPSVVGNSFEIRAAQIYPFFEIFTLRELHRINTVIEGISRQSQFNLYCEIKYEKQGVSTVVARLPIQLGKDVYSVLETLAEVQSLVIVRFKKEDHITLLSFNLKDTRLKLKPLDPTTVFSSYYELGNETYMLQPTPCPVCKQKLLIGAEQPSMQSFQFEIERKSRR